MGQWHAPWCTPRRGDVVGGVRMAVGFPLDERPLVPSRALDHQPLTDLQRRCKRALDVVIAALVLVLTLPILLFSALAVCVDSSGGPLFAQDRVGAGGRRFRLYKL